MVLAVKLHQVPRDSIVVLKDDVSRTPFTFIKIDGMYAQLRTEDWKLANVAAWTEVEVIA